MHLSLETALDLIEGRLEKEKEEFWRRHLGVCGECVREISRWQQLETELKRVHLKNATGQDVTRAVKLFPHGRDEGGSQIRSVLAELISDSFLQPAMAGARGASHDARQMVMRAEEFDIHIKIWGEPDHRQMLGQVLPRTGEHFVQGARFHLLRNGERLETTAVDESGEFHFADVPEGDLSLQIDLPNLTVIGALNVKQA